MRFGSPTIQAKQPSTRGAEPTSKGLDNSLAATYVRAREDAVVLPPPSLFATSAEPLAKGATRVRNYDVPHPQVLPNGTEVRLTPEAERREEEEGGSDVFMEGHVTSYDARTGKYEIKWKMDDVCDPDGPYWVHQFHAAEDLEAVVVTVNEADRHPKEDDED